LTECAVCDISKNVSSRKGRSRSWSRLEAKMEGLGLVSVSGKIGKVSVSSRSNFQTSRSRLGLERKGLVYIPDWGVLELLWQLFIPAIGDTGRLYWTVLPSS